jgi:hypothetical protein
MQKHPLTLAAALLISLTAVPLQAAGSSRPTAPAAAVLSGVLRVDQVGYAPAEKKLAYLMTTAAVSGQPFTVRDAAGTPVLAGTTRASTGGWNAAYPAVYPLDLSSLRRDRSLQRRCCRRRGWVGRDPHRQSRRAVGSPAGRLRGLLPGPARWCTRHLGSAAAQAVAPARRAGHGLREAEV